MTVSWGTRSGITRRAEQFLQEFELVRWTSDFNSQEFAEGAAQTFKAGQPVKLSAGLLIACVDSDTAILGIAVKGASGVTGTPVPVWVCNEDIIFKAKCTGGTPAAANVGVLYEVDLTATVFTVNLAATTNVMFRVVGLPVGFATTTHENFLKVYCVGAHAARQMN
jgi:hypothetical protein